MECDRLRFGSIVVPADSPRIGETESHGERARIITKIVNPFDRHQIWYVIEVDPDGTAFGWFQQLRDHGEYGKFSLYRLSEFGMEQKELGYETIASMREYGWIG